jgi:hypothetical protein
MTMLIMTRNVRELMVGIPCRKRTTIFLQRETKILKTVVRYSPKVYLLPEVQYGLPQPPHHPPQQLPIPSLIHPLILYQLHTLAPQPIHHTPSLQVLIQRPLPDHQLIRALHTAPRPITLPFRALVEHRHPPTQHLVT